MCFYRLTNFSINNIKILHTFLNIYHKNAFFLSEYISSVPLNSISPNLLSKIPFYSDFSFKVNLGPISFNKQIQIKLNLHIDFFPILFENISMVSKEDKVSLIMESNNSSSLIFRVLLLVIITEGNRHDKNLAILRPTLVLKFVMIISGKWSVGLPW